MQHRTLERSRRLVGSVVAIAATVGLSTGCASLPMVEVESANQNSRVQMLVLHFTSRPFDESLRLLTERTDRPVSSHYLVPEPDDPTYPRERLVVHRLVPEDRRAWHAGRSSWSGRSSLNDRSIGIEIVNRSGCESAAPEAAVQTPEMQRCELLTFPDQQIDLVIRLARDILARHPEIDPVDVVAHADIAPNRRIDPGPRFPWKRLHEHGIGAWFEADVVERHRQSLATDGADLRTVQRALRAYGYPIEATGDDDLQSRFAVRAFQMHFRPSRHDGLVDLETTAILFALLERYRPHRLDKVLAGDPPDD